MTVAEAIRAATERLSETSDTARLDAEVLMAHALSVSRSDVLLRHMDAAVPPAFGPLVDRRACHEPVAYITGVQEFFGREFAVGPGILIPRGDSETLIEAMLDKAGKVRRVLDLGTGSGALLLTALLELGDATGVGVDASAEAVRTASANAASLGLTPEQAQFVQSNWHEPSWAAGLGQFDLILCNPPYVEDSAELDPDVRNFEPESALFAGEEGLDDYRVLVPQLRGLLAPLGVAVLEIGASQGPAVTEIAEKEGFSVEIRNDLANRPRCAVLW